MRMLIFVGDGERTNTGAAEAGDAGGAAGDAPVEPSTSEANPYLAVRTRQSLADLINSTGEASVIKEEEPYDMECGEEDNGVVYMEREDSFDSYDEREGGGRKLTSVFSSQIMMSWWSGRRKEGKINGRGGGRKTERR
jgi:hypothetical protein